MFVFKMSDACNKSLYIQIERKVYKPLVCKKNVASSKQATKIGG